MRYEPVGHVVTENLGIVENRKLRKLLDNGPSFREQNNINWDTNLKTLKKAIREYKIQWARKEKVDSRALDEWECRTLEAVQTRLRKNKKNPRKRQVLSDRECQEYLADFQTRFV